MRHFDTSLFVYMPVIFFIYGISFFMLGITIVVELFPSRVKTRSLRDFASSPAGFLSFFGIIHGLYEFAGMFQILYGGMAFPLQIGKLLLLSASFYSLCKFGISYGRSPITCRGERGTDSPLPLMGPQRQARVLRPDFPNVMLVVWIILSLTLRINEGPGSKWLTEAEILSRYLMGIPGAVLSSISLWSSRKKETPACSAYLTTASLGFAFYAVGVLITPKADFLLASLFNYETFYGLTHIPTQVLRTSCAVIITFSLLRFFRLSMAFSSIRFKAILQVIISLVIPISFVLLLVCYLIGDALLKLSYRENEKFASLAANKILSVLYSGEESVKYHVLFSRVMGTAPLREILQSLLRENADIRGIAFYDEKGEILSVQKDTSLSRIIVRSSEDDQRIKKLLEGFVKSTGNFFLSGHDEENIVMTLPLSHGHIQVLLDLSRLYEAGTSLRIEKGWHILLLDKEGNVVSPRVRGHLGMKEYLEHRILKAGTYGKPTFENGVYYNAIREDIVPTGWSVIIEIPRNEIVAPVFNVFKALLFIAFFVYLSAIVAAVLFVEKITKPINLIARRVKSIGGEDFTPVLYVKTGDELQVLSEEVEKMAVSLAEKKALERQIGQTEKIASLGRLVAGVAHEINNPLNIILGYCYILLKETNPGNARYEELKTIEKHALASKKIVEDLLKFSRAGSQMSIKVDIAANIRETLSLVSKHFSKENISLVFEDGAEPFMIMGDPDRLHQLFMNLALNAVDAMKNGGGTLSIHTKTFDSESGEMVEIIFEDTGCGIAKEDMGRIFDPFFTTKEVGKGTGLGLSVSYGIVKDHNGKIWVESEVGKGTTFHIVFPSVSAVRAREE